MAEPDFQNRKIDTRVQELERVTATIAAETHQTRTDIDKLAESFNRFANQVQDWMRSQGRTNWGWMIALGGILLSIGGVVAVPFDRGIERNSNAIIKHDDRLNSIIASRWTDEEHLDYDKHMREELRRLELMIKESDNSLVQDIRYEESLRNEVNKTKIDKLEEEQSLIREEIRSFTLDATGHHKLREHMEVAQIELNKEVNHLKEVVAAQAAIIDKISREQERRTNYVYKE